MTTQEMEAAFERASARHTEYALGLLQVCMTIAQVVAEIGPPGTSEDLQARLHEAARLALQAGPPETVKGWPATAVATSLAAADSTRLQLLGAGVS